MKLMLKAVGGPEKAPEDAVVNHYVPSSTDLARTQIKTANLSKGPQLVIWSIRKWVRSRHANQHAEAVAYRTAYRMAGIPEASDILDEFMMLLATTTLRPVLVECTCCSQLSSDEVLLLRTLRSLQMGRIEVARRQIQRVLRGSLAHAFCRSAKAYVDLLTHGQLPLDRITQLELVAPSKEDQAYH